MAEAAISFEPTMPACAISAAAEDVSEATYSAEAFKSAISLSIAALFSANFRLTTVTPIGMPAPSPNMLFHSSFMSIFTLISLFLASTVETNGSGSSANLTSPAAIAFARSA